MPGAWICKHLHKLIYILALVSQIRMVPDILPTHSSLDGQSSCSIVWDEISRSITCSNHSLSYFPPDIPGNTVALNLSWNIIRFITEDDIKPLLQLETLDLSNNIITYISVLNFSYVSSLQNLILGSNILNKSALDAISGMPFLTRLDISGNRIDDIHGILNNTKLVYLDLSDNQLETVPSSLLAHLPNLKVIKLSHNRLTSFHLDDGGGDLEELDLSSNHLTQLVFDVGVQFLNLRVLDISQNRLATLDRTWFYSFPNLTEFSAGWNLIRMISGNVFRASNHLENLELSHLASLVHIAEESFDGLKSLKSLNLSHSRRLGAIHPQTFKDLSQLKYLDISETNVSVLFPTVLTNLTKLEVLVAKGSPWSCECNLTSLQVRLMEMSEKQGLQIPGGMACASPPELGNQSVFNLTSFGGLDCRSAQIFNFAEIVWFKIGSSAVLECMATGDPMPNVTWVTKSRQTLEHHPVEFRYPDFAVPGNESTTAAPDSEDYDPEKIKSDARISVLKNGSLYISYVLRQDAGWYRCRAANDFGNDTTIVSFRLDYDTFSLVTIHSIILGFVCAALFFCVAVVIGVVRYLAFVCSSKEKKKRKSIRELLDSIQDYKSAKIDKLSAYKSAKMDQLSAFRSATIDQFAAYKHARIDKLRKYKQATVTSIIQHLERMREHYALQTAKIKENCAVQVERLHDRYSTQRGKFKDYRSYQVDRIRENYSAQAMKIREYSVQQLARLREQYKVQQQYMLKLLELLDVGNCMTVIEAECMRTESIIFDADISFDFEAQPCRAPRGDNDSSISDDSHYLTASESDSSLARYSLPFHDSFPLGFSDLGGSQILAEVKVEADQRGTTLLDEACGGESVELSIICRFATPEVYESVEELNETAYFS